MSFLDMLHLFYQPSMSRFDILFRDQDFLFAWTCKSWLLLKGSLLRFLIMPRLWRRCTIRPNEVVIITFIIKIVLVGVEVTYYSEATVLQVGIFYASPINIRVSIVGKFMLYFRLLMDVILATLIILAIVVDILQEVYLLGHLTKMVIRSAGSSGYGIVSRACYDCGAFNHFSREYPRCGKLYLQVECFAD